MHRLVDFFARASADAAAAFADLLVPAGAAKRTRDGGDHTVDLILGTTLTVAGTDFAVEEEQEAIRYAAVEFEQPQPGNV